MGEILSRAVADKNSYLINETLAKQLRWKDYWENHNKERIIP